MMSHPLAIMSQKESFMNHWKIVGELVSPKNMMVGSNNPLWVTKVAFHWWPSLIHMLLYPQWTSNLVNTLVSRNLSMRLEMRERG